MEMEVALVPAPTPQTAADFNFDSTCSSPYITAPSSPQRFGNFFFSAPSSPTRSKKNCPKNHPEGSNHGDDHDFEFNFSGQLERPSLSAEELFDGGKIRPLKPPPRSTACTDASSPSPRSPKSPSTAAVKREAANHRPRGRERINSSSSIRKGSRSLSPLRVSDIIFTSEDEDSAQKDPKLSTSSSSSSTISSVFSSSSFLKVYRKWKLKDFLLFRSASEGHATSKDPLMKYAVLKPAAAEDVKNSSFRSTESGSSVSTASSRHRRAAPVSAHELHYTVNRAVSEEMRRKTFLPYRRGLLGCLGFNPGVHEISRGIGSLTRG